MITRPHRTAVLVLAWLTITGCGEEATTAPSSATGRTDPVIDPGDGGRYAPEIDPARFRASITNPYLPLEAGSTWEYESRAPDGTVEERIRVEVLDEHREVMGVDAVVVRDLVTGADGAVVEDTYDWFAQDDAGDVWYFGEETTAYIDGQADTSGSWEAGIDGAQPGIVMPADPSLGEGGYRQEHLPGEAEDMGQVIRLGATVDVPAGRFGEAIVTRDWTPLEPEVVEEKAYAPGIGLVKEATVAGEGAGSTVVLVAHGVRC